MGRPSVTQFIADKRSEGKTESEIIHLLLDAGWQMDVIQKAMHEQPIRQRSLDPILDIRKQPIKKPVVISLVVLGLLLLAAAVAFVPL